MRPLPSALMGAALGAALTASFFLTVHEGRVLAPHPGQALEPGPGERAEPHPGRAPRPLPEPGVSTPALPAPPRPQESSPEAELAILRARMKELESRMSSPGDVLARRERWLHPSPEELQEMARKCRVRWDKPDLFLDRMEPISPQVKERLRLTPAEEDVVTEVTTAFNAQGLQRLRAIYVLATGDEENARVLSPEAMNMEIFDKSPEDTYRRTLQRLSRERAGLDAPPDGLTGMGPMEQLLRFNAGFGNDYERALAEKLGASRARELRLSLGGGNTESMGCPEPR